MTIEDLKKLPKNQSVKAKGGICYYTIKSHDACFTISCIGQGILTIIPNRDGYTMACFIGSFYIRSDDQKEIENALSLIELIKE